MSLNRFSARASPSKRTPQREGLTHTTNTKHVIAPSGAAFRLRHSGSATVDLISSIDNSAVTLCTRTSEISA